MPYLPLTAIIFKNIFKLKKEGKTTHKKNGSLNFIAFKKYKIVLPQKNNSFETIVKSILSGILFFQV